MFENNNLSTREQEYTGQSRSVSSAFINGVFTYMFGALAITGIVSYLFGTNPALMEYLVNYETGGLTGLGWIVMFSPLVFVFAINLGMERFSSATLLLMFIAFSALMGMSLGFIFLVYTAASIFTTFFITAGTFGAMAFVGYTTKTDLSKMGSILYMGVIGLILATVVNIFLGSAMLDFVVSILGVIIFTGLAAYKMQYLKELSYQMESMNETATKYAILGALSLYLTFINLFMFLLRFFGRGND